MKKLLILLLLLAGSRSSFAQVQLLPKFIQKMYFNKDTSKRKSFVLLPVLSSSPETGVEAGGAALLSFYTDTTGHNTRVSDVYGYGTITTKGQQRLSLTSNYWLPNNTFHYQANIGFINFPFDFYGIGNNTRLADADHVSERRYRLKFNGEKRWGNTIYVGYVFGVFDYIYSDNNTTGIFSTSKLIENKYGGAGIYAGPSFTFDNRNNNTYTTHGLIVNAYLNIMHGLAYNTNYKGAFFNIEYSEFFLLSKKLVLGLDVQEQSLLGGASPFYLLPQMGSDEMMRGYYGGRYRDRNYIAGQTELRYRICNSLGIVGFVGTGEVFHSAFSLTELKPNYGGGLRYFFDLQKGLSVRLDYGVGQRPAGEPRETGVYIGLGQSF